MTDVTTNFKVTALHLNDELIADTYSFKNYDVNSHFYFLIYPQNCVPVLAIN